MRLFATDLDGTLLDREDGIHPSDFAAIARAREQGIVVTIATGRLTGRTHPIAQRLGLDAPLVCADGGVLACARSERVLLQRALPVRLAEQILDLFSDAQLASFVFTHDAIHSCERGRVHHEYLRGWSHAITAHEELRSASAWRAAEDAAIMVLAMGDPATVEGVQHVLKPIAGQLEMLAFDIADARVLRIMLRGVSKGSALLALAADLGIAREHIAVAGDWYNDLSMFEVAGSSYAMPHAPADLKSLATHVLGEGAMQEGAIAAALGHWLRQTG